MARGSCDGERKGASYTVKSSRSGGDYSGETQAPHHTGRLMDPSPGPHTKLPSMYLEARKITNQPRPGYPHREELEAEVLRGEHRDYD